MDKYDTSVNTYISETNSITTTISTSTRLVYFFGLFPILYVGTQYQQIMGWCMLLFITDIVGILFIDYKYTKISGNLKKSNMDLIKAISDGTDIDEIINIVETMRQTLINLKWKKRFFSIFCHKEAMINIIGLERLRISGTIKVLAVLRSDLATRLTEQRQILESAKSEVENTITGTPELLAVSELQKTRLDRQIEQFEELQRVLVKV